MPVFSRRSLQRLLNELSAREPALDLGPAVTKLNRGDEESLYKEWEIVVLYALSLNGRVRHEVNSGGTSRPDISFESLDKSWRFLGEVRTVSDKGLDNQNPVKQVFDYVYTKASELNLPGGFDCSVSGQEVGTSGNAKMLLSLPPSGRIKNVLDVLIDPWIQKIASEQPNSDKIVFNQADFDVTLTYDAAAKTFGGSHPLYDVAYSLTKNPVCNALQDKASQLEAAGFVGPMGIFLCDGNCSLISSVLNPPFAYSLAKVVDNFLQRYPGISFVVALGIDGEPLLQRARPRLRVSFFRNRSASHPVDESFRQVFSGFSELPDLIDTSFNALSWMKSHPHEGRLFPALEWTLGGNGMFKARISARAIIEILAGRSNVEEFSDSSPPSIEPFAAALSEGRLIRKVEVVRLGDVDDDILEFHFGSPDPAIAQFTVPIKD